MWFEDPTDTIFFASSIFYSIALQKAAQSLHADTQHLGYGCFYRVQGGKKNHCQVISSNTATDFKRGLHRSVLTHSRRYCTDRHYHIVKRQEQGSPSKEEEEEEYLSSVPWTKNKKTLQEWFAIHSLVSDPSPLMDWLHELLPLSACRPRHTVICFKMSVNSIVSEKYKSLEKLIRVPKKSYSFFPGEEEGRGGRGETRNGWGVLEKSIIVLGGKRASCKGLGQRFRASGV